VPGGGKDTAGGPVAAAEPTDRPAVDPAASGAAQAAAEETVEEEAAAEEAPGRRWTRGAPYLVALIVLVLVLAAGGFVVDGANRPADPRLVPAPDPGAQKGSPAMGATLLSVSPSGGSRGRTGPVCVLEASTVTQQNYGLMNRPSVTPYAGMAFVFPAPTTELFYMRHTRMALSIAWFDPQGRFEAATVMPPCPDQVRACPTYGPGRPYSLAVEVPAGQLGGLGIGPGSVAQVGVPCG
jgi:uncharacterized membrane protein (UPF0127 family)